MQEKRSVAAASMTTDGLLVTGGNSGSKWTKRSRLASTEYFSSGQWVSGPDLPLAVGGHCQVTVGSAVIVTGRFTSAFLS